MRNVLDIADLVVEIINSNPDDTVSNLKLNKLLYFAQGVHLARNNVLLFEDEIEAWNYGPVVRSVYDKYKKFGKEPIVLDSDVSCELSEEEQDTLIDVIREFGKYTGAALVNMTHKADTPWSNTVSKGENVIDAAEISAYFKKHPVPKYSDLCNAPVVNALPNDWYDEDEDDVWKSYL